MLSKERRETIKRILDEQLGQCDVGNICLAEVVDVMLLDSIDRFIEHRIETDKVITGLLLDIQCSLATIKYHTIK